MKRLSIYLFICCAALSGASAQGWRQTYDGLLNPAAVCETPDGGAVLLANTVPGGPEGRQIVLIKTDQDGRKQWEKTFGAPGDDEGRALLLTHKHEIAVVGKKSFLANNGDAFFALFSLSGQQLWEQTYNYGVLDDAKSIQESANGAFVLAVESANQLRLLRTDSLGVETWSAAYPQTNGLSVKDLVLRPDSGYVVSLFRNALPIGAPAAVVMHINNTGDVQTELVLPHNSNYQTTEQVRCVAASDSSYWLLHRDSVYLLNRDTVVLRRWEVPTTQDFYLTGIHAADQGLLVFGTHYSLSQPAFSKSFLARYKEDGTEVWRRFYEAPYYWHSSWALAPAREGGLFMTGNYALNGGYYSYVLRSDSLGQVSSNKISGQVYWDRNKDCTWSADEPRLAGWLLRLTRPNGDIAYATTDSSGRYEVATGIGQHTLELLPVNALWEAACGGDTVLVFDGTFQQLSADFRVQEVADCPLPRVDLAVDYWQLCSENLVQVNYRNLGSALTENAFIVLTLDSLLSVSDAEIPYIALSPRRWKFELGNLDPLAEGSFWVKVNAGCGPENLDRTLCATANIEPSGPCNPFSQPFFLVGGRCEGDSVYFHVQNIGVPSSGPVSYIVIEDNIMFLQNEQFQLSPAGTFDLRVPANGSTWRFELRQDNGGADWLGESRGVAVVEGCTASGAYSTGFLNQYSLYDAGYFYESECRAVVAQNPGLGKTAYPVGREAEHFIEVNTDIEYMLHYNHSSSDTLLFLVLRDTLDPMLLNPASVTPGSASHPYQFELAGPGVLSFRFDGAALGDSASVWVKFRVSQQVDNPGGSVIYNRAWAYPAYAAPFVTNETFHTIVSSLFVATGGTGSVGTVLQHWPSPTTGDVYVQMGEAKMYRCRLSDGMGSLLWERQMEGPVLHIDGQYLPAGRYHLAVYDERGSCGHVPIFKLNH